MARKKCECTQGYCCDHCWRRAAKADPCQKSKGCKNPHGHTGPHGALSNTGVIQITAEDILSAMHGDAAKAHDAR